MVMTSQMVAQSLIERAAKFDPMLAADIRAFAQSREYGLVFEHNRPEQMRLYGKHIGLGDTVQILPDRGKKETDSNKRLYHVLSINGKTAILEPLDDSEDPKEVRLDDLVAIAEYDQPIYAGLRETGRVERGGDKPYQVVINGENYHALEALAFAYAGKVDCIYIDPPYNSGAHDWKYNNDYVGSDDAYRHSKWLAMMERRLKLAKNLLNTESSVLICSIDEKEYLRLGLLIEQTFPDANIQMITTVISQNGTSRENEFSRVEEYLFICRFGEMGIKRTNDNMLSAENKGVINRVWFNFARTSTPRSIKKKQFFPIFIDPNKKRIVKIGEILEPSERIEEYKSDDELVPVFPVTGENEEVSWGAIPDTARKLLEKGLLRLGKYDSKYHRWSIQYVREGDRKRIDSGEILDLGKSDDGSRILQPVDATKRIVYPKTVWNRVSHDATSYGTRLLKGIIPKRKFSYPKSLYAVEDVLRFFISDKPNAIVMDFFAGSGTTAHALMRINHQDGGCRQCISVTNNEVSEDEEKGLTLDCKRYSDSEWKKLGICEYITKPRIKSVITGKTPEGDSIKGDYKFNDVFPMKDGFNENAVFFELTYENPNLVELGEAFEEVAPLLWLRAGSQGRIIEHEPIETGYASSDVYAVLFDYSYANEFIELAEHNSALRTLFVVTDDEERYRNICEAFPERDVVRLYESYLRSFKIASEGALA